MFTCEFCNKIYKKEYYYKKHIEKCNENENKNENELVIENCNGIDFLKKIKDKSIDLILTDPPYIISKETGMDKHYKKVKNNKNKKTEEEWIEYKKTLNKPQEELDNDKGPGWSKENYLLYGSILGKKYCKKTDFGDWDNDFTMEILEEFIKEYYKKLRDGGTLIIWFDIWKISHLKELMEKYKFKQIRFIEWIKTNPQPINSKVNYLTNSREIALLGIKKGKPTFNSSYDNGIYKYPMAAGKYRFHPTQKNLNLFIDIIKKHSNENDVVLDTFLGGGTTAIACKKINRNFTGCELNPTYFKKFKEYYDSI